jgi:hypothetical protein
MKTAKYFWVLALVACLSFTMNFYATAQDATFGAKITEAGAKDSKELTTLMKGKESLTVKLKGKIIQTCKKKGCWMEMDLGNGKKVRVTFKDYEFFVPKDESAHGKDAVIEGVAKKTTTDVKTLRHYAQDAGKTKEEIEKITEPKEELTFEATGVIIKDLKK